MTPISNNVVYIINRIVDIRGEGPGKKLLQKIVFLLEEKGVDLGFQYGMHFYGPYSETLDSTTALLSADGIIEFDFSRTTHYMKVNNVVDATHEGLSEEELKTIDEVISYFKNFSAFHLELLTTAMYAYNHLEDKSKDSVIRGVKKLKGQKYSDAQIQEYLEYFPYFNKHVF